MSLKLSIVRRKLVDLKNNIATQFFLVILTIFFLCKNAVVKTNGISYYKKIKIFLFLLSFFVLR